jgi:hypothetical protein
MGQWQRKEHPSNHLFRGDVTDFYEAMRLVEAEFDFETAHAFADDDADSRAWRERVRAVKAAVKKARSIYWKQMQEAMARAAAEMREAAEHEQDTDLAWIANAVQSGDYSRLAI